MATYCDIYDIQAELPHLTLSATSKPTDMQVEDYIEEIGAEMDAAFESVGISLPLIDTRSLMIAEQIATLGVSARTLRAAEFESERERELQALYDAKLKRVMDNPSMLVSEGTATPSAPTSYDPGSTVERKFRREEQDW